MAVRTNNAQQSRQNNSNNAQDEATLIISGTLDSVYVGKKYAYAKIKSYNNGQYYTMFTVACPLDYDFPDDGQPITIECNVTSYNNEYKFSAI